MTDFIAALELTPAGENRWTATISADWGQGRTTFGGLLAALATEAAVRTVGSGRPIRTLDVAFVAPVSAGPVEIEVEVLGRGKAVTQLVVSIRSGGVLGCRVHVVAGAARVSALTVSTEPVHLLDGDPQAQGIPLGYIPDVTPMFIRNIEIRWCSKFLPFSAGGPETSVVQGWARHRSAADSPAATVAILDAWPPAVLPMALRPIPTSTVRWAIHLTDQGDVDSSGAGAAQVGNAGPWFWYEARTLHSADGYATTTAALFSAGRLVAWSEQLVVVYD